MDPMLEEIYANTDATTRPLLPNDNVSEISIEDSDAIQLQINHFSEGYNDFSIKILTDGIPKAIDDVKVLSDVIPTAKIEDVGNKLYLNFLDLLKAVDITLFGKIIISNFNVNDSIMAARTQRIVIEEEIMAARAVSEDIYLLPDKLHYDLRSDHALSVATVEIRTRATDTTNVDAEIELARIEIKHKFNMQFLTAVDTYGDKIAQKNKAQATLRDAQQCRNRAQILEMVLKAFEAASRKIVTKIKDAVHTRYPTLTAILKGSVILPGKNETIHNPWDGNHLPGLGRILYDRFHKPSFVYFNNALIDAMSFSLSAHDTKFDPMKGVQEVQGHLYQWQSRSLWDQMSPDLFWTAILLRGLHPSVPLRHEVLQEVNKFIRHSSEENLSSSTSTATKATKGAMPYFNFTVDHIQLLHDNRKFESSSKPAPQTPPVAGSSPPAKGGAHNKYPAKNQDRVELAAAATSSSSNSSSELETIYNTPGKYFKDPVPKSQLIFFQHPSKKTIPYYAVAKLSDVCTKCYPDGKPSSTQCTPPCYNRQCTICHHYGHAKHWCLQSHTSKGVAIN